MSAPTAGFVDDVDGIPDGAVLYRHVSSKNLAPGKVDVNGLPMIGSQAFQDRPEDVARQMGYAGPCLSVGVAALLEGVGGPQRLLAGLEARPGELHGVVALLAGEVRRLCGVDGSELAQGIMLGPGGFPGHAVIFSMVGGKKTGGMQKALARLARWEIPPRVLLDSEEMLTRDTS